MEQDFRLIHTRQVDAIASGDDEFKKELVCIFLEQIPEFITNMNQFYQEEKWVELAREAHTAKSSVLTFGMEPTGKLLKQIQHSTEKGFIDQLPAMIEQVVTTLQDATLELESLRDIL